MSKRKGVEVSCTGGGKVRVAGEHVGTITVGGQPTNLFDDDYQPATNVEALARDLVAKFGIAKARMIVALAREAKVKGESVDELVAHCEAAGIDIGKALRGTEGQAAASPGTQQSFGFDVTHEFLGEEFLLWLWFCVETKGGQWNLNVCGGQRAVGVAIDDLLVFAPRGDDETTQTLRNGLPTRTAEARTALRHGHRVARAKLIVAMGTSSWTVTIDGRTMASAGVKLPTDSEDCEDASDRNFERAAGWRELQEMIEKLYERFLRLRVGKDWITGEAAAIAQWMAS